MVEDEEKDRRGVVIRRVVRRPVMVTTKRTVIRKLKILPDGEEKEIEKSVEESPRTEKEPEKTRRVVRRVVKEPTGEERVTEEPEYVSPLEISTTEESEPELEEKIVRGQVIRTVCRRSVITSQRRIVRRVVERKDGKPEDVPIEDTVEEPVEPTKFTLVRRTVIRSDGTTDTVEEPQYEMPVESEPTVEEEKNRHGVVIRRVVRRTVRVVTRRRVYRKIILAPDGTERDVEEKVEEPQYPRLEEAEESLISTPTVADVQESVPDVFEQSVEGRQPSFETLTKREVHRSAVAKKYIPVERRISRKIMRMPDGHDHLIYDEESLVPLSELESPFVGDNQQENIIIVSRKIFTKRIMKFPNGEETVLDETVESEFENQEKSVCS